MYRYVNKPARCGAPDSKYMSNPEQFEKDIEKHKADTAEYKKRLRNLLLENPNKLNQRYHQTIAILVELKKEFDL